MSAWVVVLLMLGQSDGGLSIPPPPPEVVPEGLTFPRVIRNPGEVCVESLEDSGAVKRECKPEKELRTPPKAGAREPEPLSRAVADFGVHGGGLLLTTGGGLSPELAITGDIGVRFRNGVGVVGFGHGHFSSRVNRYGLGAALRLGERSHITVGASIGPIVINPGGFSPFMVFGGTVFAQLALVFATWFSVQLLPTLSIAAGGAIGSLTAGLGVTF
jgi:hypothetical protein